MASERNNTTGPTILWSNLKGKKVKASDGKDLGEIKEVSDKFLRLEKGTVNKDKFWIPKYVSDVYDGKSLWLVMNEQEVMSRYAYGKEQPSEEYTKSFQDFRGSEYGKNLGLDDFQTIKVVEEKEVDLSPETSEIGGNSPEKYRNIRDPPD